MKKYLINVGDRTVYIRSGLSLHDLMLYVVRKDVCLLTGCSQFNTDLTEYAVIINMAFVTTIREV